MRELASRYGARPRTIRALKRRARRHGLVARVDRSGVFARLPGSVRTFKRSFHARLVSQVDNDVSARTWFVRGNRPLRLPRWLRPPVREVVAVYARTAKLSSSKARPSQNPPPGAPGNAGTWTGGCDEARATGSYSFGQVRNAYGIEAVGTGAGASVAFVNVGEGLPASDIARAADCFGLPRLRPRALLVRLGLAGVGAFASAGDFGSTCNNENYAGIAWPASSPYLTAVGGTRLVLDSANTRVDEVVWNDLQWLSADNGGGAGVGGLSSGSARPPWQSGLTIPGRRRAAPDVAAHASTLPGWPVVLGANWLEDGGTSASSPLVASAFAVLSARERAAGRPPLGPVNALLYSLAQTNPAALFDIVSGSNGYNPRVPGINATPGYDMASGLGVPRFDQLAAALPPSAP